MSKIVEYLFEGFLVMLFCTAISVWVSGNENINILFDLTKRTVESDTEVINTSHVKIEDKYQDSLGIIPYDESYSIQQMKNFINSYGPLYASSNGTNFVSVPSGIDPADYNYLKVNGRCYKKIEGKFLKQ